MSVWGAAVRQFVPGWRGRLSWAGGCLSDDSGVLRGFADDEGMWRADTRDRGRWTHVSCAASFEAACEAMAIHLRAAGFEVPERPEVQP